jgi:hypothetical protein
MAKVLIIDIETALMEGYFFSPKTEYIPYKQVKHDWFMLSFSAKWLDEKEIIYFDQRNRRNIRNDKPLLKKLWKLLDKADIIISKNGKRFDKKKIWARLIMNGLEKPSSFRHIDIEEIMRSEFAFTYNSLEYVSDKLCKLHKKTKSRMFHGIDLWIACANRNLKAFEEMEKYNKKDVLSTEESYKILSPWKRSLNFSVYHKGKENVCACGSNKFHKNGFAFTDTAKYQRYRCSGCSAESRGNVNLLEKEKVKSFHKKVTL